MKGPALQIDDLVVARDGKVVLRIELLGLPAGELSAVAGPNGSGKSTLLLAVAGLVDLRQGEVRLDGARFHAGRAPAPLSARRRVCLALQQPYMLGGSALANAAYGLRCRGVGRAEREAAAQAALDALGAGPLAQRRATDLSVGEQKLVSLAQAAVLDTDLLLLDEPLAGLDEQARARVAALVSRKLERGCTVLVATHGAAEWESRASVTARLLAGEIV
ncbi:MAG: ATP-binding cassette domain-containing protein [Deltaproteobacteria bacterium]|nr:ATP-binding cassette domain-containing protein [Deltaproteobacteria bacterium]